MAEKRGKGRESIHFIITGGTIDSFYNGIKDTAVPLKHSCIPAYIESLQLYVKTVSTEVCMKDSRSLKKQDVNNVLKTIEKSSCKRIIITHGTYTMPDTARYLKANLTRKDQTIILTGSMIPITGFSPSDAPFNLGFALAKVLELRAGIYVAMNGKIFSPEEVSKFISKGRFISIFSKGK